MISTTTTLLRALSGLQRVQDQVLDTMREIDPNTYDPQAAAARQKAKAIQVEAAQQAGDVANALRQSVLDVKA